MGIPSVRIAVCLAVCVFGVCSGWVSSGGAATISAVGVKYDVTDFSSSGYPIGTLGYWFANVGAPEPVTNAPINQNQANGLPSWAVMNFPSSFPVDNLDGKPYAVSQGGLAGANQIKLPNGATDGSGQLVDVRMTANGSDTLIKDITFDANAPTGLYFSVVLDNVPLSAGTQISRVRATYRMPQDGNTIVRALFDIPLSAFDGIADVYTFRLDGIQATGYLALQLTTTGNTTSAGMAGFAFDTALVPEPSGLALLAFGAAGIAGILLRKRGARR